MKDVNVHSYNWEKEENWEQLTLAHMAEDNLERHVLYNIYTQIIDKTRKLPHRTQLLLIHTCHI